MSEFFFNIFETGFIDVLFCVAFVDHESCVSAIFILKKGEKRHSFCTRKTKKKKKKKKK